MKEVFWTGHAVSVETANDAEHRGRWLMFK